jgi:CheY-like chemotaxis protein
LAVGSTPPRVVVADDDPPVLEFLRDCLTGGGYSVVACGDCAAALAAIRADPPALILLDYLMPELDGLAVVRTLQADPRLRATPVLLLAGADIPGPPGVAAMVRKPVLAHALLATVRSLLERGPAP